MADPDIIACMYVSLAVEKMEGDAGERLRSTLIREGVKSWLGGMTRNEVEQIAALDTERLREYVAQHALEDINNRYAPGPDEPT